MPLCYQLPFADPAESESDAGRSLPYRNPDSLPHARRAVRDLPLSEQPRVRLVREGAEELSITDLVAVILGSADALDLAQAVVSRFEAGYLCHVTVEELQTLYGIGPTRAARVVAAIALGRRLLAHREVYPEVRSPAEAASFLLPRLAQREEEHFVVLLLNTKRRVTGVVTLYRGSLNSSVVRVGEVYREAVRRQAAAILVAHNHPSGAPRSA